MANFWQNLFGGKDKSSSKKKKTNTQSKKTAKERDEEEDQRRLSASARNAKEKEFFKQREKRIAARKAAQERIRQTQAGKTGGSGGIAAALGLGNSTGSSVGLAALIESSAKDDVADSAPKSSSGGHNKVGDSVGSHSRSGRTGDGGSTGVLGTLSAQAQAQPSTRSKSVSGRSDRTASLYRTSDAPSSIRSSGNRINHHSSGANNSGGIAHNLFGAQRRTGRLSNSSRHGLGQAALKSESSSTRFGLGTHQGLMTADDRNTEEARYYSQDLKNNGNGDIIKPYDFKESADFFRGVDFKKYKTFIERANEALRLRESEKVELLEDFRSRVGYAVMSDDVIMNTDLFKMLYLWDNNILPNTDTQLWAGGYINPELKVEYDQRKEIMDKAFGYVTNTWTPTKTIKGWNGGKTYYAGETYYGVPYSQHGHSSPDEFEEKINTRAFDDVYKNKNGIEMSWYGQDCSGFVSDVWGLDRMSTDFMMYAVDDGSIPQLDSYSELRPGDAIVKDGHTRLVSYVVGDKVYTIEQTTGNGAYGTNVDSYSFSELSKDGYVPISRIGLDEEELERTRDKYTNG